jgi:hypothetical protein
MHDTAVPFAEEIISADRLDLDRWEWWSSEDGGVKHYYASGPCPVCGATTQGHLALIREPADQQGTGEAAVGTVEVPETVEVPVMCLCGANHGHEGAKGCGRHWSLLGSGR